MRGAGASLALAGDVDGVDVDDLVGGAPLAFPVLFLALEAQEGAGQAGAAITVAGRASSISQETAAVTSTVAGAHDPAICWRRPRASRARCGRTTSPVPTDPDASDTVFVATVEGEAFEGGDFVFDVFPEGTLALRGEGGAEPVIPSSIGPPSGVPGTLIVASDGSYPSGRARRSTRWRRARARTGSSVTSSSA